VNVEYDQATDSLYISLRDDVPRAFGRNLDESRYIDFGEDGQPIGIELLGVSRGVKTSGLPEEELVEKILRQRHVSFA
jgi:uncharacterized protein YuzE